MSALEKTPNLALQDEQPAEVAGIFLEGLVSQGYDLLNGSRDLFKAVADTESLKKAGRYIGTKALPGFVIIEAIPDQQGNF